jgi:molybdopterin converting factor subunit 1
MEVRFRLFASLAEKTGTAAGTMELTSEATVRDLWEALVTRFPALAETGFAPMVACDMEYAGWDSVLQDVDEVAFLPPVSGG